MILRAMRACHSDLRLLHVAENLNINYSKLKLQVDRSTKIGELRRTWSFLCAIGAYIRRRTT